MVKDSSGLKLKLATMLPLLTMQKDKKSAHNNILEVKCVFLLDTEIDAFSIQIFIENVFFCHANAKK